jgi:2-keto-3-deoxy-L-fuconate dehydrogenase
MVRRLYGKTAFVSAAGAGIGRATARAFHAQGAQVWAADLDGQSLASLLDEAPGMKSITLDVCDEIAVREAFDQIGQCDVLFNGVGVVPSGTVQDGTIADFASAFDINVLTMARTIRAALPGMLARGGGAIINVSSVASSITAAGQRCIYGVTKAAVIGLTKSVALDYVALGIRCNAICPGTVDTPSLRARAAAQGDEEAGLAAFRARQPMGRLGSAEEIAALAVYLASEESGFVTGQAFAIDGGWTI